MRTVYLAGSFVDKNKSIDASKMVFEAGFATIVPALFSIPDLYSKELLRLACEKLMQSSDFVVMLPGWENNEFAQWEYRRAKEIGVVTFLRIRELFRLEVA